MSETYGFRAERRLLGGAVDRWAIRAVQLAVAEVISTTKRGPFAAAQPQDHHARRRPRGAIARRHRWGSRQSRWATASASGPRGRRRDGTPLISQREQSPLPWGAQTIFPSIDAPPAAAVGSTGVGDSLRRGRHTKGVGAVFALPESWVWDFWIVDDGDRYHLFFLFASKALGDPEARHHRAAIGHAVSDDLRIWTRVQDALVRSDGPAFDDRAIWTGCTVRDPDGSWLLVYTGVTSVGGRYVQSIGLARSTDLLHWTREGQVLAADPRWYETIASSAGHDEAFRDPWVFRDGEGWRMLITARADHGPMDDRGVIGTAVSDDLRNWTLEAPLSEPGSGFGQLEVMETVRIGGQPFLMFNCLAGDLSDAHRATGTTGGVWTTPSRPGPRPWDPKEASLLVGHELYVGRVIETRQGETVFLAFRNFDEQGRFVGTITDPMPIGLVDGVPRLTAR
jgi:beta-fructofuranosidase